MLIVSDIAVFVMFSIINMFTAEPPAVVRYDNAAGGRVSCSARGPGGHVAVTWLADDNTPLVDVPNHRRVYKNGTVEFLPSMSSEYGGDTTSTIRCRAENAHGTLLSRNVHVMPVSERGWQVAMVTVETRAGGVAALRCRVTGARARPVLWYRRDAPVHLDPPAPESRYLVAGDTLLIRSVSAADAGAYSCVARHDLTAHTKRSPPAHLAVVEGASSSAPRLVSASREVSVSASRAAPACLPCAASDYPPPHYTWYRELQGRLQPVEPTAATWLWAGGAALCLAPEARAGPRAGTGAAWLCKAYNVFGDATAQLRLDLEDELTVSLTPDLVLGESGSTVRLNCSSSDPSSSLQWLHNGALLTGALGPVLVLRALSRSHAGLYQCVAHDGLRSAQASTEIRLGDSPPELQYTFIEQALRAGGAVPLRCVAAATPPPRFLWLLDSQPLHQYIPRHRYSISEETSESGEVASTLNITSTQPSDGGHYTCRATNSLGEVQHSARLNIYGPPSVRQVGAVRAVAGDNVTVLCPYAGYPISSVRWSRRGGQHAVPAGEARVSARGAALSLAPALSSDAGVYQCAVSAPPAPPAHLSPPATIDIEIQVRNPPKISPFMFSPELTEGSSVQVLCGVSSGDKPMYFSWLKDGAPLSPKLQIEEKSLNEFSLLMFPQLSAQHSGEYTCRVTNHAAAADYTATLTVNVAPSWLTEPSDTAVLLGSPLRLDCAARGHPVPRVTWYRRIASAGIMGLGNSEAERWEAMGSEWKSEDEQGDVERDVGRASVSAPAAARALSGRYRCGADNAVGPPLTKHVNVTVHEAANFGSISEESRNVSGVRGESATLSCLARGDAPLALHWSHRGTTLDTTNYRWRISEVRTSEGVRSSLSMRVAERRDAGEYRCHAANHYGRSDILLFLHVLEPPEAPRALQLWGVSSRSVRVRWQTRVPSIADTRFTVIYSPLHAVQLPLPSDSTTEQYNLTLDQIPDKSEANGVMSVSASLEHLNPATAYSMRLVAINKIGQSPHSEPLLFTTLEDVPSAPPRQLRATSLQLGELRVTWTAPPQESWNGEVLGYVVRWREVNDAGGGERGGRAVARGWSGAEVTLGALRDHARYAVTVRAFNRAGPGPPSDTLYCATDIANTDPVLEESPTDVTCESTSARSVRVRWVPRHPRTDIGWSPAYDILYTQILNIGNGVWSGAMRTQRAVLTGGREATVQGLHAATNYSLSVRMRSDRGTGPQSTPVYCRTRDDVAGAPEFVRAVPSSPQSVRVTWLPVDERTGRVTHYTLYIKELAKIGGEWSQRVEARPSSLQWVGEGEAEEISHEVRGLRERAVYEFWLRASTSAGAGPPSRAVTAAPAHIEAARVTSVGRGVSVVQGGRVVLACAAVGAPPLVRRWVPPPLPGAHTVADTGDLLIHNMEAKWAINYTCSVRNTAGGESVHHSVQLLRAPATPVPRLARASLHQLHLAWDSPQPSDPSLLGYSVWWWEGREPGRAEEAHVIRVSVGESAAGGGGGGGGGGSVLRALACGALYTVTVQAHSAAGVSSHSRPLVLRTRGDKAKAPSAKECIWSNSTVLRVSLLAWGGRCPVASWAVAFRAAAAEGAAWTNLDTDAEVVHMTELQPATWYDIRVLARSSAGDTMAIYRAATRTYNGERIGEPTELPSEAQMGSSETAVETAWWGRAGAVAAAVSATALLSALLATAAFALCHLRHRAPSRSHHATYLQQTHTNGKTLETPHNDLHEISPYATFSMSSAGGGCESVSVSARAGAGGGARGEARSCALHLRSFAREPLELAAAPPRPHLLAHPNDYGSARDTDSESSGSPCAACAAELYRLPAAHLSDTLPAGATTAAESSTEDGSYGSRRARDVRDSQHRQRARRREHGRPDPPSTVRYVPVVTRSGLCQSDTN